MFLLSVFIMVIYYCPATPVQDPFNTVVCNVLAEETTNDLLELQAPHKTCCGNGAKSINFYKMEE